MSADYYPASCCFRERMAFQLYSAFREPKCFRLAVDAEWSLIPGRCKSHPKEAAFVHRYAPNDTALHRLLRNNNKTNTRSSRRSDSSGSDSATKSSERIMTELELQAQREKISAMQALLKASATCATLADVFGRTPVHLACMDSSSFGIDATRVLLNFLYNSGNTRKVDDQSVSDPYLRVRDVEGRTPLHWLLLRHDRIPEDVLETMLTKCPQLVEIVDDDQETPGDIARRRQRAIDNCEYVLEQIEKSR